MKSNKFIVVIIIFVTLTLSAVAIYTSLKLYQLRNESISLISPKSKPLALTCEEYDLSVDTNGIVRITNNPSSVQPAKTIDLLVNGQSIGSFDIPQLDPLTNVEMGNINLPEGDFTWSITGDVLCQGDSGGTTHETTLCQSYNFTVNAQEPNPTPIPTVIPSLNPTANPTLTSVPTDVPTTSLPTPTSVSETSNLPQSTSAPAQLPDSGISFPTIFSLGIGITIILGAFLMAI